MATQHIIKKAIGEGTRDLMRQKTVNEISVTEICEKVGISRRNFYRYFRINMRSCSGSTITIR